MYDLLKKLNTLVSAQVNDLTSRLPNLERKPDLERQVVELRESVAEALEHEDRLRAQVAQLQQEIAGLDARVDAAIQAGQEGTARALLEEIQRLQKRLAMAEADLRQHQNSAADLIGRVNALESAVGDLKASQASAPATPSETTPGSITQFMPPAAGESRAEPAKQAPASRQPAPQQPRAASEPAAAPQSDQTERKPWDKPKTAKEAAEWAREDAESRLERTTGGVEHVGGLLRDIQSRVTQRMNDLDRMLAEGGLADGDLPPAPSGNPASSDVKPPKKSDDDLNDRLSRLVKPD